MEFRTQLGLFLLVACGSILMSGCASCGTAVTASPAPSLTSTQEADAPTPQPAETQAGGSNDGGSGLSGLLEVVPILADFAPTRTTQPTTTPDVLAGYLSGTWLIRWLIPRLVRRTKTILDDRLLQVSDNQLRWPAVVLLLGFTTRRLTFLGSEAKTSLLDFYFFLTLFLLVAILWRLINLAAQQAEDQADKAGRRVEHESLIMLSVWLLRLVLIINRRYRDLPD